MHARLQKTMMQGWYYVENLTGQRHDRVQTERQELQPWTAVSTLLGLVCQHGVTSYEVINWSTDYPYPLNADGDDLRWNSNSNFCRLANVTCKARDKGQQEKSRISCRCHDKETADRLKLSLRKIFLQVLRKPTAFSLAVLCIIVFSPQRAHFFWSTARVVIIGAD